MKKDRAILICLIASLALQSCACVALKKSNDRRISRYVNKHLVEIYALGDTLRHMTLKPQQHFLPDSLPHGQLRKHMAHLGEEVTVSFPESFPKTKEEPCDSVVVFEYTSLLLGVREIIYDFSVLEQPVEERKNYRYFYGFKRIAPRIYIRRSQIPMM